jgi:DNA replication protein DnaC
VFKRRVARATGTYERKLEQLAGVPVLILADFALKWLRSPQDGDFHDLIVERRETAATLLRATSTLANRAMRSPATASSARRPSITYDTAPIAPCSMLTVSARTN